MKKELRQGLRDAVTWIGAAESEIAILTAWKEGAETGIDNLRATIERVRVEIEDIDRMAELSEAYGTAHGRLTAVTLREIADRLRAALDGVGP